jgi:hypothetical protein
LREIYSALGLGGAPGAAKDKVQGIKDIIRRNYRFYCFQKKYTRLSHHRSNKDTPLSGLPRMGAETPEGSLGAPAKDTAQGMP